MIVPDTNLLVYAYNDGAREHELARRWWEELIQGDEPIGLPWVVSTGFVRLMAHPKFVISPMAPTAAANHLRGWLRFSHVIPIEPGPGHLDLFQRFLAVPGSGPNLVPDAHIAAVAMEHDAEVHTADKDFGRFPGVRWRNPLVQEPTG